MNQKDILHRLEYGKTLCIKHANELESIKIKEMDKKILPDWQEDADDKRQRKKSTSNSTPHLELAYTQFCKRFESQISSLSTQLAMATQTRGTCTLSY